MEGVPIRVLPKSLDFGYKIGRPRDFGFRGVLC